MPYIVASAGRSRFTFTKPEAAAEVVSWLLMHGFSATAAWEDDDGGR